MLCPFYVLDVSRAGMFWGGMQACGIFGPLVSYCILTYVGTGRHGNTGPMEEHLMYHPDHTPRFDLTDFNIPVSANQSAGESGVWVVRACRPRSSVHRSLWPPQPPPTPTPPHRHRPFDPWTFWFGSADCW